MSIEYKISNNGEAPASKPFYTDYSGHFLSVIVSEFVDICGENFQCPPEAKYNSAQLEIYNKICSAFKDITDYAAKLEDDRPLTTEEMGILNLFREIRVKHKLKIPYKNKGNC